MARRGRGKALTGIRNALAKSGRRFSDAAENVADVILDPGAGSKSSKGKKIKKEIAAMADNIGSNIKGSLEGLDAKDALCEVSYLLGRASKRAKDSLVKIIRFVVE